MSGVDDLAATIGGFEGLCPVRLPVEHPFASLPFVGVHASHLVDPGQAPKDPQVALPGAMEHGDIQSSRGSCGTYRKVHGANTVFRNEVVQVRHRLLAFDLGHKIHALEVRAQE